MSTVLDRRVASTPVRSAAQTWEKVVQIVAPDPKSEARKELDRAAGVACASISSEATQDAPIVVWGGGPRVRVYCVFGEDAITGDGVNEAALPESPLEGDWHMSIPCLPEDVEWSNRKLAAVTSRVSARSLEDPVDEESGDSGRSAAGAARTFTINEGEFLKS